MNIFFADNGERYKSVFVNECPDFNIYEEKEAETVDVLVVDACSSIDKFRARNVNTCFCPSSRYFDVVSTMKVKSAISCGMREKDSVTFSSISETEAMICLKRKIVFFDVEFEPCEFRVKFSRSRGLYSNLALGALKFFIYNSGDE